MNSESQDLNDSGSRRSRTPSSSIGLAILLILLGLFFLARQIGGFSLHNWWALFILIPAISAFGSAYRLWLRNGRFTFSVWSTFYGGLFPLLVAFMFLLNLDWGRYWPLFVILPGFGLLVSGLPFKRESDRSLPAVLLCHRPWALGFGLSAILVGLTFLGRYQGWMEQLPYLNVPNWWGIFILIPAIGGLLACLCLLVRGHAIILAVINLIVAGFIALTGYVAMMNLDWRLINQFGPAVLILIGLGLIVGFGGKKAR